MNNEYDGDIDMAGIEPTLEPVSAVKAALT